MQVEARTVEHGVEMGGEFDSLRYLKFDID